MPITQAPRRNMEFRQEIRRDVKVFRLLRRPVTSPWYIRGFSGVLKCDGNSEIRRNLSWYKEM
jgi:hypothetical protein